MAIKKPNGTPAIMLNMMAVQETLRDTSTMLKTSLSSVNSNVNVFLMPPRIESKVSHQ